MPWFKAQLPVGGWAAQRILISGASGGIGQALANELATAGAQLLITGRRTEALQRLNERYPHQVSSLAADLTRAEERAQLVEASRDAGINMLINAAGMNRMGLFETWSDDEIQHLLTLNLTSTLQLTRELLPQLLGAEHGWVVNLGSTFGTLGYPGQACYCASKFGLHGFSQALRRELSATRVRVLHVSPRATRTDMNAPEIERMNSELGNAMDSPEYVASEVRRAVERGRNEVQLGMPERFYSLINALMPGLVDRALARQLPVIRRFIGEPEQAS
ncbi:short-subunit dehydrogenase [Modicisalibacter xianhensis]|uniref:Short-subunit dehydrogenase n=1 Tax=Modicisalibacter xianhensis TaxID=442341 RepID=A0A4R8FW24_9GAMM|nr:SDR family oxidoreductase [Halomonas xianhensis]TDX31064.1 short-subunit dehydrogenase [Halomonas xianhensis]